jgi:hypothetical protein
MHAAVEDEPLAGRLDVVTIGADLGPAREVDEFQISPLTLTRALALGSNSWRVLLNPSIQAVYQAHQHRDDFQELLLSGTDCFFLQQFLRNENIETRCTFERGAPREIEKPATIPNRELSVSLANI